MPTVLLTGISGFVSYKPLMSVKQNQPKTLTDVVDRTQLAAHVALSFLQHGWHVHATLRSDSKRESILAIPAYAPYVASGQLRLYAVGDLSSADYGEAMEGVEAVVHTASPVEFGEDEFRESHLAPALEGTRRVLEAAAREGSVKAVVYTSTYGAVGNQRLAPTDQVGAVITEEDWNPYTLDELDKIVETGDNGGNPYGSGALFYMGAKKYAELAAWEFQKTSGSKWSLATMNCVMIYGPPTQSGLSTQVLWALAQGKDTPVSPTMFPYYVDVRDAAEAHYQAVVLKAQGRFILSAGPYDYQEFADELRALYPDQAARFAVGTPGKYDYRSPGVYDLRNEKSVSELGVTYRPKVDTLRDAFDRFFVLERQEKTGAQ